MKSSFRAPDHLSPGNHARKLLPGKLRLPPMRVSRKRPQRNSVSMPSPMAHISATYYFRLSRRRGTDHPTNPGQQRQTGARPRYPPPPPGDRGRNSAHDGGNVGRRLLLPHAHPHKPVADCRHRLHIARRLRIAVQRPPDLGSRPRERVVRDERSRPDRRHDLVLGQRPPRMFHQKHEQPERLRFQRPNLPATVTRRF
jgi:hypothetical protein